MRTDAREHEPEYVVLDLNIAGTSGLTLIAPLLAANPECRIVVLTGYGNIATAVRIRRARSRGTTTVAPRSSSMRRAAPDR